MKKLLTLAAGLGLVFTIAGNVSAASNPGDTRFGVNQIANGVVESRHNMGSTGVHYKADNTQGGADMEINRMGIGGTSEVCIFCHTPHHGSTNAPLWNKGNQGSSSYTTYGTTVAGTTVTGGIGAATLACLSCHDGVNTFDTIVNWPGKSGVGTNDYAGTTDMGWIFTEDGNTKADIMTSGRLNLGTDLSNDHPVSIVYSPTTKASLRPLATVISSIHMTNSEFTGNDKTRSRFFTENLWAVGGVISETATISDLLRNNKVECSSCHDPHFKNQSWDEVAMTWASQPGGLEAGSADMDGLFLRRVGGNSLSGVCRTCHNK